MSMKIIVAVLLAASLSGCVASTAPQEQPLLEYNEGVVVKHGPDGIIIKDYNDAAITFSLDEKTGYSPEGYRALAGDTVGIRFRRAYVGQPKPKYVAVQLDAIAVATENRGLTSPLTAQLVTFAKGTSGYQYAIVIKAQGSDAELTIYVGDRVRISDKGREYTGALYRTALKKLVGPGGVAAFEFSRLPVPKGNGYMYVLHGIRVL